MRGDDERRTRSLGPRWPTVVVLAVVLAFGLLGTRGLWEPDEGRYGETAREMVRSGDWVYPQLHGLPHFTKPPLTYWAIGSGLVALGDNAWGARLYLGFAFAGTIVLLSAFGESLAGDPRGRWAGPVYATSLFPFVTASIAIPDTLLVLFEVGALYAFWVAWSRPERARAASIAIGACLGLAFLTKGPPGLLPLLVVVPFALLVRDPSGAGRFRWLRPEGLAAFVLLGLPWYLLVARGVPGLVHYLVVDEVVGRVATAAHDRNAQWYKPLTLYLPILTAGMLPWAATWPALVRRLPRPGGLRARPAALLLALWVVAPAVLFSVVRSRQPVYVLPIAPALVLATVLALGAAGIRRVGATVAVVSAAFLGLRLYAAGVDDPRDARSLAAILRPWVERGYVEIVAVDLDAHALEFYLDRPVEEVRTDGDPVPRFRHLPALDDELGELATSSYRHLFVVASRHADALAGRIREAGGRVVGEGARDGRSFLLVAATAAAEGSRDEVVVLWDAPGADVDRLDRALEVERRVEARRPGTVVVLLDPASDPRRVGVGIDPGRALWRLGELGLPVIVHAIPAEGGAMRILDRGGPVEVRRAGDGIVLERDGVRLATLTPEAPVARLVPLVDAGGRGRDVGGADGT